MAAARRRRDAGLRRRRRAGAQVDQGAAAVHAVGDRPVLPDDDARYEQQFIAKVQFTPIPSLWGHPAGAGASPEDRDFLNKTIAKFLAGN